MTITLSGPPGTPRF